MTVKCQLLRPHCLVLGLELHSALGMLGPVPMLSEHSGWLSAGMLGGGIGGDEPASKVKGSGTGVIRKSHASGQPREHFLPIPGAPPVLFPLILMDLGLYRLHANSGEAKAAWSAGTVKAGFGGETHSLAVLQMCPPLCVGGADHVVCSDPISSPITIAAQIPNSVFAGFTNEDLVAGVVTFAVDALIDHVVNALCSAVVGRAARRLANAVVNGAAERLLRRSEAAVVRSLVRTLEAASAKPFLEEMQGQAAAFLAEMVKSLGGAAGGLLVQEIGESQETVRRMADRIEDYFT